MAGREERGEEKERQRENKTREEEKCREDENERETLGGGGTILRNIPLSTGMDNKYLIAGKWSASDIQMPFLSLPRLCLSFSFSPLSSIPRAPWNFSGENTREYACVRTRAHAIYYPRLVLTITYIVSGFFLFLAFARGESSLLFFFFFFQQRRQPTSGPCSMLCPVARESALPAGKRALLEERWFAMHGSRERAPRLAVNCDISAIERLDVHRGTD